MSKSKHSLLSNIREIKDIISEVGYFVPGVSNFMNNIKSGGSVNNEIRDAIKFAVNSIMNDPYVILGVSRKDPDDLINKVYKVKVKYYHTDNKDTGDVDKFLKIFESYKRIKDDRRRR